jgi:hypothetical protein
MAREVRGEEEEIYHLKLIEQLLEQMVNLLAQILLELKPKQARSIAIKFEKGE